MEFDYYESLFDAQDIAKQVDGAVMYNENGWAVQYTKMRPYYPGNDLDTMNRRLTMRRVMNQPGKRGPTM